MEWLEIEFWGNTVLSWMIGVAAALGSLVIMWLVKRILLHRLEKLIKRTRTQIDDHLLALIRTLKMLLLLPLAIYIGAQFVVLPVRIAGLLGNLTVVALLAQGALSGSHLIVLAIASRVQRSGETDPASTTSLSLIGIFARMVLWVLVLLLALDNLGFDVTTLVAGLGIGGVAIALAAQNILGDLFASLSIVLDKPFVVGDFIIMGDFMGSVERIGLKTTRIRSLGGEQIVLANAALLNSQIRNYKRMNERRVLFGFGVIYQTPKEKLERIPGMVREIVEGQPLTRFDRAHFKAYGDSSLDFEVVYYMLEPDYNRYMDTQQAINLALFERFEREHIEFAYPTRTVYQVKAS